MLALWLQQGGWWRYALVFACLFALTPAQWFDRAWDSQPVPPVFASLPQGAHVLVLPEFGMEMGWQRVSSMRFVLVGQGYLGGGYPASFRNWALFSPLWQNRFAQIKPHDFAAYLAYWHVQYVVLLSGGYDYVGPDPDQTATVASARRILAAAGWASVDGTLYRQVRPAPADTAVFAAQQRAASVAQHRVQALRREVTNVCILRHISWRYHLPQHMLERAYALLTTTPIPLDQVKCPPLK
jgi:hypothetical protein